MSDQLYERAMQLLLDTVDAGRFPSVSMLDRVEANIADRQTAERYVALLLDKLNEGVYPSPTMLDRVLGLVAVLQRAPT